MTVDKNESYNKADYEFSKKDKKEINAVCLSISVILKNTPIKSISYENDGVNAIVKIERYGCNEVIIKKYKLSFYERTRVKNDKLKTKKIK